MLLAAIDIGTNAVRLFFSNVFRREGRIMVEKASLVRMPIRLGEDVFVSGRISGEKTEKLVKTMRAFALLIDVNQPAAYRALATSAMREAKNSREVIERVFEESGIRIEVIDGLQEALLVSAFSDLRLPVERPCHMFIDVGGGSTEISLLQGTSVLASDSFRIGTVRLLNNKVQKKEWVTMKRWLKGYRGAWSEVGLIGSGGNINKLNKLYGNPASHTLTREQLESGLTHLEGFSLHDRIQELGLRPDRADVIVPAGHIFRFIMKQVKAGEIYVPKIGLSDGIVHTLFRDLS